MKVEVYKEQRYARLLRRHKELGLAWTDPTFPPNDSSIGLRKVTYLPSTPPGEGAGRRGVGARGQPGGQPGGGGAGALAPSTGNSVAPAATGAQGRLGNCWLVAAASVLAGVPRLWERVVPGEQDPREGEEHSGIFRFRFWQFGQWVEVLVDDWLPCRAGLPLATHSRGLAEWWPALLEKAYAKLHGSYEALDDGNLSDALVDFTGGVRKLFTNTDVTKHKYMTGMSPAMAGVPQVSELIALESERGEKLWMEEAARTELFRRVTGELEEHALLCCAVRGRRGEVADQRTDMGLVGGPPYV